MDEVRYSVLSNDSLNVMLKPQTLYRESELLVLVEARLEAQAPEAEALHACAAHSHELAVEEPAHEAKLEVPPVVDPLLHSVNGLLRVVNLLALPIKLCVAVQTVHHSLIFDIRVVNGHG